MKAKRWHSQNIQELQKRRPGRCPALWQERQISYPSYLPSRAQSGPKFSASDSNAHSHQHGQVKCNLFASPVREFNVFSHIHARGFRTAELSIHEGLERAVFWSGDGHWEGGLRFAPGLLTRPNLNLCNGNKTALVLSNWLPCIIFVLGSRMQLSLKREKSNKSDSCIFFVVQVTPRVSSSGWNSLHVTYSCMWCEAFPMTHIMGRRCELWRTTVLLSCHQCKPRQQGQQPTWTHRGETAVTSFPTCFSHQRQGGFSESWLHLSLTLTGLQFSPVQG